MKQVKLRDGQNIVIREADKSDAVKIMAYLNRISYESDNLTFGPGELGISLNQEELFIEAISRKKNSLFIIAEFEELIIGNLNFSGGTRPRTEHTGEFGVSVLKDYWAKGLGTELVRYLIDWSKNSELIKKINLRVRTDNSSAINVYKKLGFKEEGTITRELKVNDRFYDTFLMGLTID